MPIYSFPQSEPNFGEAFSIALLANRPYVLEAYGRAVTCVTAGAVFKMAFNNGKYFDMAEGARWALQENERFNTIKLLSTVAQTVSLFVGNMIYEAPRNIIVAPTRAFPGPSTIAGTSNIDLNTVPAGATYRKSVIVTNNDAAVDLDIYTQDASGTYQLAATVFHQQAWYVETSDNIRIRNGTGGTVNLRIVEIFYLSQ